MKQPIYSIMKLDLDHIDEICEDIRLQYEEGIATCALFYLPLVPVGDPPAAKAEAFAADYRIFRKRLCEMGLPSGILVQSSIGHGYPLHPPAPFPRYVNLNDGKEEFVYCPSSDEFCAYIQHAMTVLASTHPDMIMVDDDFRLIFRGGNGCACPWHMKRFRELSGMDLSREELFAHLKEHNDGDVARAYIASQEEAILKGARAMRAGIDAVNPKIPGAFCCSGNNMESAPVAKILAGEGNPVTVRILNGVYYPSGNRAISGRFYRAALQAMYLGDEPDFILAEADTVPHNRYAISAQWFHTHYVGSVLEGIAGAKRWITRLDGFEPESGKAFRKILSKYRDFYAALIDLVPSLEWVGCRIPMHPKKTYYFSEIGWHSDYDGADGWAIHVLERLGLPLYFSEKNTGVAFFAGKVDEKFTDEEMTELLRHKAVFPSDVALRLQKRGFGKYLGAALAPWEGAGYTDDRILATGSTAQAQRQPLALSPADGARVYSVAQHTGDRKRYDDLFPSSTMYENSLGGTVCLFAGTPVTEYTYDQAFSFLTESRKKQLVEMMREMGELPVYYDSDEEVYLRAANLPDGGLFVALFNLSYDVIEEMPFDIPRPVSSVSYLGADGREHPVPFRVGGGTVTVEKTALPMDPVILFFR